MRRHRRLLLLGAVGLLEVACSSSWTLRSDDPDGRLPPLAFLQSKQATLRDVEHELGAPSRLFPDDRVSMWELVVDGERLLPVASRRTAEELGDYMLVVAFGEGGQVAQWSLVRQCALRWTRP